VNVSIRSEPCTPTTVVVSWSRVMSALTAKTGHNVTMKVRNNVAILDNEIKL